MKTFNACLIASVVLSLSSAAAAQPAADARYCSALADKYEGFLAARTPPGPRDPQETSGLVGIEQCRTGSTTTGIPLLESSLHNVGLDLPSRDAASTFIAATHAGAKR